MSKAPAKPFVYRAPDGKEFTSRPEYRDYMMATYYSFKEKRNEAEPLVKAPGSIDGQQFDIADCENSTLVIMDNCEQVQIDMVKNCRIFIGACASSIFIRNCEKCVFYTCCRQLRLREVVDSTFYIYSMAEVHIEYSNTLRFAPFNGGYPEHARHLAVANLNPAHNLWYDIFDHNDPSKTRANWSLLPEAEYEEPWFPGGACEPAIPRTKAGSVKREEAPAETMQSFSIQQMMADAAAAQQRATQSTPPIAPVATPEVVPPVPPAPPTTSAHAPATASASDSFVEVLKNFANYTPGTPLPSASSGLGVLYSTGKKHSLEDFFGVGGTRLWAIDNLSVGKCGSSAWATFWLSSVTDGKVFCCTATWQREDAGWVLVQLSRTDSHDPSVADSPVPPRDVTLA